MIFNLQIDGGVNTKDANATANDILHGKTAYVGKEKVTGTMPNNGNGNNAVSNGSVKAGYTSGGKITNLDPDNIKKGVNIGGVVGSAYTLPSYVLVGSTSVTLKDRNSVNNECCCSNDIALFVSDSDESGCSYFSTDETQWVHNGQQGCSCTYVDNIGFFVTTGYGANIYKSTNCKTWTKIDLRQKTSYSMPSESGVKSLSSHKNIIVGCCKASSGSGSTKDEYSGLVYSLDGGISWQYNNKDKVPWSSYASSCFACWSESVQKWYFVFGSSTYNSKVYTVDKNNFGNMKQIVDKVYGYPFFIKECNGNVVIGSNDGYVYIVNQSGSQYSIRLSGAAVTFFQKNNYYFILAKNGDLYRSSTLTSGYTIYKNIGVEPIEALLQGNLLHVVTQKGFFYMLV